MHTHTISTTVHLAATFAQQAPGARTLYAKPGEPQPAAIKRYMAWRRREWHAAEKRDYPPFKPGETSPLDYARHYFTLNDRVQLKGGIDHLQLSDRPQALCDDTVQVNEATQQEIACTQ